MSQPTFEDLVEALWLVLPYAESRAEDLVEYKAAGTDDPECRAACAAVERAYKLLGACTKVTYHDIFNRLARGEQGGFLARLADAWFVADSGNREAIQLGWNSTLMEIEKQIQDERMRGIT